MENKKYMIGNMKMNFTFEEVERYFNVLGTKAHSKQVIFCPTYLYVPYFIEQGFETAVQNTAQYDSGAYTGEVSPVQAASIGCSYTILGHSERRMYFHETDDIVSEKVKRALAAGLSVILCVGESDEEEKSGNTEEVLKRELTAVFSKLTEEEASRVIVAYEPIWAIGTGRVPTNDQIWEVASDIQKILKQMNILNVPILYGGSVNEGNIETLNQIDNISGFLVGGACLKPEQFLHMIEVVL